MKQKLTFLIVALTVLSACNKMRELTREGLYGESDYGSMQPVNMDKKYQTPPLQEIPLSKNVVKGTHPNGLPYYIYQTNRGGYENSAFFQLIQKSGSLVEDDDQLGVAHFVEHYAYNGTKNLKGTRYADRPVIGTIESINQMTLQNLKDYYLKWYQPTFANGVKAVVSTKDCPKYFFQIYGIRQGMLTNFADEDAQKIKMLNNVRATPYMSINTDRIHTTFSVSDYSDEFLCYVDYMGIPPEAWLRYMYYCLTNKEIDTI